MDFFFEKQFQGGSKLNQRYMSHGLVCQNFTFPETNSKFAPENVWLEYFLVSFWGVKRPIFRGELAVSFKEWNFQDLPGEYLHPFLFALHPRNLT